MCEYQFGVMAGQFDDTFAEYVDAYKSGKTRETPATRVHDLAFEHQELCSSLRGRTILSWYLAIALERLAALETSGLLT